MTLESAAAAVMARARLGAVAAAAKARATMGAAAAAAIGAEGSVAEAMGAAATRWHRRWRRR